MRRHRAMRAAEGSSAELCRSRCEPDTRILQPPGQQPRGPRSRHSYRTHAATHHGRGTYTRDNDCRSRTRGPRRSRYSPISGSAASSTVGRSGRIGRRPCFGAVAGVVDVLAGDPIRRDLQAHWATARVAEQPPASTPVSLPERTTRDSYERAMGRARGCRFEPAEREPARSSRSS